MPRNSKYENDKLAFAASYSKFKKTLDVDADRRASRQEVQRVEREFRITIGKLGVDDPAAPLRLSYRSQVREDAETLCISLSLRLSYHPDATYIVSMSEHSDFERETILRALTSKPQFLVRLGRTSGLLHIKQKPGWTQAHEPVPDESSDQGIPDSCTVDSDKVGIYSRGEVVEAEELDDLTIHLRQSVEALMLALKPFKTVPTTQLELF